VACISPSKTHYDESLSTIQFAHRAMDVKTRAKMNEEVQYQFQGAKDNHGQNISKEIA